MSKRQKAFHDSLANEKTRVRLYKSGKNWVKSGIKEIEMFKIMGLPFISHSLVSQDNQSISKKMTGYGLKTTAVIGGAFTVNMLHDQQAFAASDAPLTSELNTQSETVGNQNSTTIEASTSTADSTSVTKIVVRYKHQIVTQSQVKSLKRSLRQLIVQAINKRN
ncbi:serine-rich adhesin, platelet-type [Staphylococcus aureus]|uniref:Serine-rich adhesin, platelet-type n=1 Tax=Staphylococcus aureus TaxID=1280 RepID=A0A380EMS0_STAAU|nr:serine-rich adhesin, platelet-type [Staphylococcus aureus]